MEKRFSASVRRALALVLALVLVVGCLPLAGTANASAALPFAVTADKEGSSAFELVDTGRLIETANYANVPLYTCALPEGTESVWFQLQEGLGLEDRDGYEKVQSDHGADTQYRVWLTEYGQPTMGEDYLWTVVCPFDAALGKSPKYAVSFEYAKSVEKTNVAFVRPDGSAIEVDDTNTLTVSLLEDGVIVNRNFTDTDGMVNTWKGQIGGKDALVPDGLSARKAMVVQAGETVITMEGFDADWNSYEESFNLKVLPTGITELKAELDGVEILPGTTYNWRHDLHADGNYAQVGLYGKVENEWVKLPVTAYNVTGGADAHGVYADSAWRNSVCPNRGVTGTPTITVALNEPNGASMSFLLNVDAVTVNLDALNAALEEADALLARKEIYDADKIAALKSAVAAARNALQDPTVSQATVDEAAAKVTAAIEGVKSVAVLYFETEDGTVILPDEDNVFTLNALKVGKFHVSNAAAASWDCEEYVSEEDDTVHFWKFWIAEDGTYQPKEAKRMDAAVTYVMNGEKVTEQFVIDTQPTGITEIRVFAKEQALTPDTTLEVEGREWIYVAAQGLLDGEWIDLPQQAYEIVPQYNIHTYENKFRLWETNKDFTITVRMKENNAVSASFKANACVVPLTGFTVEAKQNWELDRLFFADGRYVGVARAEDPEKGYVLNVEPANATELDFQWISSDPSVAEFEELHSAGIVPYKAGNVHFTVVSKAHPEMKQELDFSFTYKTPLESVVANQAHYDLTVGQTAFADLRLNPVDATQQRFVWTYDSEGVVSVETVIELDEEGIAHYRHPITALGAGEVIVTGTPVDDTANCLPVRFTVKVQRTMPFTDVHAGQWFYEDVAALYESGMMTGISETAFGPYQYLSRGLLVTMLYRYAGSRCPGNPV